MTVVGRPIFPWLLAAPLMVSGSLIAHELSYRIIAPGADERATLLASTGHGYLEHLSLVVAVLATVLVSALALRVVQAARGIACVGLQRAVFFALPLIGFGIQEHLERLLSTGAFPLGAVLEPTFAVGLVLQIPFALVAYLIACVLLSLSERIGAVLLRQDRPPRVPGGEASFIVPISVTLVPTRPLARGFLGRAPPLPV